MRRTMLLRVHHTARLGRRRIVWGVILTSAFAAKTSTGATATFREVLRPRRRSRQMRQHLAPSKSHIILPLRNSKFSKTEARDDAAEVQESMASVLQYATEEVHRHLGEISSGMQGATGSGLLTRVSFFIISLDFHGQATKIRREKSALKDPGFRRTHQVRRCAST